MDNNINGLLTPLYEPNKGMYEGNISELIGKSEDKNRIINGLEKIFDVAKEMNTYEVYARGDIHSIHIGVPNGIGCDDLEKVLSEARVSFTETKNIHQIEAQIEGETYLISLIYGGNGGRSHFRDPTVRKTLMGEFFNLGKTHPVVHIKKKPWEKND